MSEIPIQPLSKEIISALEEKNIHPRSRWQFVFYYVSTWVVVGLVGIITSLLVGMVAFFITNHDWDVSGYPGSPFILSVLRPVPYILIGVSVLLVIFLYCGVRKTRYGYKYESSRLLLVSVATSIFVGIAIFTIGINEKIQTALIQAAPWYGELIYEKNDIGIYPERGYLGGIVEESASGVLSIKDALGHIWEVRVTTSTQYEDNRVPAIGNVVRVIGEKEIDGVFDAQEIRSWSK